MRNCRPLLIILGASLLNACATSQPGNEIPVYDATGTRIDTQKSEVIVYQSAEPSAARVEIENKDTKNPAVIALMQNAKDHERRGDYVSAAGALERAIRISPRDAELYLHLARLRLQQKNYQQAEQLCRKAISLEPKYSTIANQCEDVITASRRAVSG